MARRPKTTSPAAWTSGSSDGWWLVAGLVIFGLTRFYLLAEFKPVASDVAHYLPYVSRNMHDGQMAYSEIPVEFPPLAWWSLLLPHWLTSAPLELDTVEEYSRQYHRRFHGEWFVAEVAALALFILSVRRRRPDWTGRATVGFVATTTLLWPMLYERFDVGLLMFFMLATYAWLRSVDDRDQHADRWALVAYGALGAGIAFKLIPVLTLPLFALAELRAPIRWRALAGRVAVGVAATLLPFAVHLPSAGWAVFDLFKYHGTRGIEINSVYSSGLILCSKLGLLEVKSVFDFGSENIESAWSKPLQSVSTGLFVLVVGGTFVWALFQGRKFTRNAALAWAWFVVCAAVAVSKVLSTQYFIWVLPLLIWVGVERLTNRQLVILLVLATAIAGMSTWLFPYNLYSLKYFRGVKAVENPYGLVPDFHWPATLMLLARNGIYVGLVAWVGAIMIRRGTDEAAPIVDSDRSTRAAQGVRR